MELHRIAVISDTHGLLRPEVSEKLKSCEAILHAGDFGKADILEKLRADCPVWAVRGNVAPFIGSEEIASDNTYYSNWMG